MTQDDCLTEMVKQTGREIESLKAERDQLRRQLVGQDGDCYYCEKPTNSLHGCPTLWPVDLCHKDEPGVVKVHHVGCVSRRLQERDQAQAKCAEMALIPDEMVKDEPNSAAMEWWADEIRKRLAGNPGQALAESEVKKWSALYYAEQKARTEAEDRLAKLEWVREKAFDEAENPSRENRVKLNEALAACWKEGKT